MDINNSFWTDNFKRKSFDKLNEDIETEICIIGAGITGLTTAYYLAKKGKDVVVLEKDSIASKTTGHTTGKVSIQHGLFYNYLTNNFGFEYAKKYALINLDALNNIKDIIDKEKIECDFEIKDSIVYSEDPRKYSTLQEEANICKKIGISADFISKIELPTIIQGAVKFKNQAQFNPIKYINGLCTSIISNKAHIYENTKVTGYDNVGKKIKVICESGKKEYSVLSDYVVVATRYPIFDFPGMYFLKNYQEIEYALCAKLDENIDSMPMYLSTDNPSISFRSAIKNNERYLLAVGNGAKTGEKIGEDEFKFIEEKISSLFGKYTLVSKWVAEDVISLDKIPYIGKYSKLNNNMYVATGFKKWGMTFSNVAAGIITNDILNESNKYYALFDPLRIDIIKNKEEFKNMMSTTCKSLLKDGNHICSHLGCKTVFNMTTNTWDCPCHGSRYEKQGNLIDGPSKKDLKIKK